jgi:two-component system chemotaxis response regulator CheB
LAEDGAGLAPGKAYLAPSDHHVALDNATICVFRGARENGSRPSIDTLFRSAAVQYRGRVVAVLLSGYLHDGSVGLSAVKRCGGTVIVQAPDDAIADEMPRRALQATSVDYCIPAAEIGPLLLDIVQRPATVATDVPEDLRIEARLALSADDAERQNESIGQPAQLVCPDCSGPLWQITQGGLRRYRCLVGHAFSSEAMLTQQSMAIEQALWVALRALKERRTLLGRMADDARTRGHEAIASGYDERLRELDQHTSSIERLLAGAS